MKVTLYSTEKLVTLNGVPARVWEGTPDSNIPVHAFITCIAVDKDEDTSQFEEELAVCLPPRPDIAAYPDKLVL